MSQKTTEKNAQSAKELTVRIANGPGSKLIEVSYKEGDTVASVLARAGIELDKGTTATLGNKRVDKPEKTTVSPDDLIVVAGMPSNG